jgi:hypothetical protein
VQHAVYFLERGLRIAQHLTNLVMQQGVLLALFHPGRAADDDDG